MGEFDLIDRFFRQPAAQRLAQHPQVALGIGDDCALLTQHSAQQLAITSDMLVCGRHFFADAEPEALGHKCLAVNLSDLAAMGAAPHGFTLALALPDVQPEWLAAFARGMLALADEHRFPLVGGDTTAGPLTIAITALGHVPTGQALRRDGAKAGDDIWVSGSPGDARLALALRLGELPWPDCLDRAEPHAEAAIPAAAQGCGAQIPAAPPPNALAAVAAQALARMDRPTPRVALGLALRGLAHSAADVSDGLLADLGHILSASGVGAHIQADAALQAAHCWREWLAAGRVSRPQAWAGVLAGGDDYELVFTAAPTQAHAIAALGQRLGLPLTRIGRVQAEAGTRVCDAQGQPVAAHFAGFDHFS